MNGDGSHMRIGQVAERAGVRVSLIRYYEDIGLLPEPDRVSGQRRYDESVLRRLAVIDVAQRAGLSLEEIKELVDHGNDPVSARLRELAERRLPEIDALIDRAQHVRSWLELATGCGCQAIDDCALFDDVDLQPRRASSGSASVPVQWHTHTLPSSPSPS
jgi:MerR family transcriptional regulator, redox-sensitive transcriptional activator SoxR